MLIAILNIVSIILIINLSIKNVESDNTQSNSNLTGKMFFIPKEKKYSYCFYDNGITLIISGIKRIDKLTFYIKYKPILITKDDIYYEASLRFKPDMSNNDEFKSIIKQIENSN